MSRDAIVVAFVSPQIHAIAIVLCNSVLSKASVETNYNKRFLHPSPVTSFVLSQDLLTMHTETL